jgi:HIRAN domain
VTAHCAHHGATSGGAYWRLRTHQCAHAASGWVCHWQCHPCPRSSVLDVVACSRTLMPRCAAAAQTVACCDDSSAAYLQQTSGQATLACSQGAEEQTVQRTYLGVADTQVVGIQHYSGHVANREVVTLRREPNNPYDRNATQVLNTLQEQVGHLPRVVVLHLAPLADSGNLFLEGVIPRGSKNKYKIPVKLFVYCKQGSEAAVRRAVSAAGLLLTGESERVLEVRAPGACEAPGGMCLRAQAHARCMCATWLSRAGEVETMVSRHAGACAAGQQEPRQAVAGRCERRQRRHPRGSDRLLGATLRRCHR